MAKLHRSPSKKIPNSVTSQAKSIVDHLTEDIAYIRSRCRLSQNMLAELLAVTPSLVSCWMAETKRPGRILFLSLVEWAKLLKENETCDESASVEFLAQARDKAEAMIIDFPADVRFIRDTLLVRHFEFLSILGISGTALSLWEGGRTTPASHNQFLVIKFWAEFLRTREGQLSSELKKDIDVEINFEEPLFAVPIITRALNRNIRKLLPTYKGKEITPAYLEIMNLLHINGQLSMNQIAKKLEQPQIHLYHFTQKLIDYGLVVKQVAKTDGRVRVICLTPTGKDYFMLNANLISNELSQILSPLSYEQKQKISKSLKDLRDVFYLR